MRGFATFSDMTVGPVLTFSSGSPFDLVLPAPFNNGAPLPNNVSRPYHAQRNSGHGPAFHSTDLRFTKAILSVTAKRSVCPSS